MATTSEPEILSPRWKRGTQSNSGGGGGVLRDENLDLLSHLLDDFIRVPGTSLRFGLDGIIGLIPGVGDLVGGLASTLLILAAWARGVPKVTLLRMVANVGIEVVIGTVPVLGDLFDIAWRANRRNYALLTGSVDAPRTVERRSWVFFAGLCAVLLVLIVLPLVVFSWLTAHFLHAMFGADLHRGF